MAYVAYMEGSPEGDYQDISHQLCRGQSWPAHSCPGDKTSVHGGENKIMHNEVIM